MPTPSRTPTADQQEVLESTARIRLVRAAPGSGKTWLVAEAIRGELAGWSTPSSGIAALSFTRVGGDEIRNALGCDLAHPHFVGTLDAFLFRYVVRPHLRALFPALPVPVLVPGEWEPDKNWRRVEIAMKDDPSIKINPFACVWIGRGADRAPVIARPIPHSGKSEVLGPGDRERVLQAKHEIWRTRGLVTHSDSAFLAASILRHNKRGPAIREALIRRYPLIVVDELQDTGHFLSESTYALLKTPAARGLLVGDPDQAIYEFNGARPQLFDSFRTLDGTEEIELTSSRRCPPSVAAVASSLRASGGLLQSAEHTEGHAYLVRYTEPTDVTRVVKAIRDAHVGGVVKVVARLNSTIRLLTGRSSTDPSSLGCRPATALHRGVQAFRRGRPVAGLAAARTAIDLAMFDLDGVDDAALEAYGIDPAEWKALAVRCLLGANALPTAGTVLSWQIDAHTLLVRELGRFGSSTGRYPKKKVRKPYAQAKKPKLHETAVRASLPDPGEAGAGFGQVPVQTVHAVKGETHQATIFVCPPTKGAAGAKKCPSALWWSSKEADAEERRVAYVAATRSRGDLVLCVDEPAYERLSAQRPEFVRLFECCTVTELEQDLGERRNRFAEPPPESSPATLVGTAQAEHVSERIESQADSPVS